MSKEKKLTVGIVLIVIALMLIPSSLSVIPQELNNEKAETYLSLAFEAKQRVDELIEIAEEISISRMPSTYELATENLIEAQVEFGKQEPNLSHIVNLLEDAMAEFRSTYIELYTTLSKEGRDLNGNEETDDLRTAIERSYYRLDRVEEIVVSIEGIDISEELAIVNEARSELNKAAALLEAGRTIEAKSKLSKVEQLITQTSTSMHSISETRNYQKIEAILLDLESYADRVKARLERVKVELGPIRDWEDLEGIYFEAQESTYRSRTLFSGGDIRGTLKEIKIAREKLNLIWETLNQNIRNY